MVTMVSYSDIVKHTLCSAQIEQFPFVPQAVKPVQKCFIPIFKRDLAVKPRVYPEYMPVIRKGNKFDAAAIQAAKEATQQRRFERREANRLYREERNKRYHAEKEAQREKAAFKKQQKKENNSFYAWRARVTARSAAFLAKAAKKASNEAFYNAQIAEFADLDFSGWNRLSIPREEMKPGVKCATSRKQIKVRKVISEPEITWFCARIDAEQVEPQKPKVVLNKRNYRQMRLSNFFQSFRQREYTVARSTGETKAYYYGKSLLQHQALIALFDGLIRAKVKLMTHDNELLRSNLEHYMDLEQRKSDKAINDDDIPKSENEPYSDCATPNMEEPHGDQNVSTAKAGNVALQNPLSTAVSRGAVRKTKGFLPYSSATETQQFSQLTDRWLKYSREIKWSSTQTQGTELLKLRLPYDILVDNANSPNVSLFKIHKYARTSMKVRIVVNSNKFQVGQLQCSWMYGSHYNANMDCYDNIFSASQRKHVLINAGASNWGEIDIPYWHLMSLMSAKTNPREVDAGFVALTLGELSIKVLAPLTVPEGATVLSAAYLSLEIMFYDCDFRGMCDASLHSPLVVNPQMEDLVNTTERVLNLVAPVFNMDNPIKPAVAMLVQPTSAHSFSTCKEQNEILSPLRANPLGQTPGLFRGDGTATNIRSLLSKWSLLTTLNWKNTDAMGTLLKSFESSPIMSKSIYSSHRYTYVDCHRLPIMAVLANFFAYWRGDIEMRIDFVASQFHSGAIMISTIPGGDGSETIDQAKNSASQIFSLTDQHQCTYRIPYYGNVPFWKTRHNLDRVADVIPPSSTNIYVFNPLIPMQNITPIVQLNIYIRGADNFEFALLKSPSIGSSLNKIVYKPTLTTAWVDPEWPQAFTSSSRWSGTSLCLFDSETTDYFTQFLNLEFNTIYKVPDSKTKVKVDGVDMYVRIQYYSSDTDLADVGYIVRLVQYPSYPVVACFDTLANAKLYAKTPSFANLESYGLKYYKQGPWAQQSKDGKNWYSISRSLLPKVPFVKEVIEQEYSDFVVLPQIDDEVEEVIPSVALDVPASTTSFGYRTFGEDIQNLTEACKRWQHYGCGVLNFGSIDRNPCLSQTNAGLTIGVFPRKIFNVWGSGDRDNRLRDGLISLVTSGYAGYRGGIRFRVMVSGQGAKNITVGVTHKFDKRINLSKPSVQVGIIENTSAADWLDTAYASTVQSTFVNNCLEFEVPFYNRGEYNSCYVPVSEAMQIVDSYSTLGQVKIYFSGFEKDKRVGLDVYYSIADDFAFSNFQGFPDMLFLDSIPDEPPQLAEPNMEYIKSFFTTPKKLGDICDNIATTAGSIGSKVVETLSSITGGVSSLISAVGSKAKMGLSTLLSTCGGFAHSVLCQILHILNRPTCKFTLAIAIFSILCAYFSDKVGDMLGTVSSAISKFWSWLVGNEQRRKVDSKVASPQLEEEDENCATFVSLLWSIVATAASYIGEVPKNMLQFGKSIFKKSADTFRTHVFGIKFFRDFLKIIKRMWGWINRKLGFSKPLYSLAKDDVFLKDWFIMSSILLAPENENELVTHPDWIGRLFECQIVGRLINQAAMNTAKDITPALYNAIKQNQQLLTKQVEGLIQRRCYVPIRQEPFIVWAVGRAGIGKTHLVQQIMRDLASEFKVKPDIFSLVANQQYYDMLVDQKFVLLDDFLNWTGQGSENAYAQYLQMSGSNMLSLPRAVCDKKAVLDNFEFLFVTSNDMFFDRVIGISHPEAYNRRRHMTIGFELTPAFIRKHKSYEDAMDAFRKLPDASKSANVMYKIYELDDSKEKLTVYNYDDLITHVKTYARAQRETANIKFLAAVKQHCAALEVAASESLSFDEYFNKLREVNADVAKVTPDSVDWIVERLKSRYAVYTTQEKKKEEVKPDTKLTESDVKLVEANKEAILKDVVENKITFAEALAKFKPSTSAAPQGPTGPTEQAYEILKQQLEVTLSEMKAKQFAQFEVPYIDLIKLFEVPQFHNAVYGCEDGLKGVFGFEDSCPHAKVDFSKVTYFRFTEQQKKQFVFKDDKMSSYPPTGCFVDTSGARASYQSNSTTAYACFDVPCLTPEGGLDRHCCWVNVEGRNILRYDQDLAKYWSSLLGIIVLQQKDFLKFIEDGDDKLLTIMPHRLLQKLKKIYESDKPAKLPRNLNYVSNAALALETGFLADRLTVAGVHHGVYPTQDEVKDGERDTYTEISRSSGILYDSVKYAHDGKIHQKYRASTCLRVLINIGMVIAGISGILMFLNMVLTFLEYWGIFSFYGWNTGKDVYNPQQLEDQMSTSGDIKMQSSGKKPFVAPYFVMSNAGEQTGGILQKITSNVFFLRFEYNNVTRTARCLGICGKHGLVLTHYLENFKYMLEKHPEGKLKYFRVGHKDWIDLKLDDLQVYATDVETGYRLVKFGRKYSAFRDIRCFMPSVVNVEYTTKANLVETNYDDELQTVTQNVRELEITLTRGKQYVSAKPDTGMSDWSICDKLEYKYAGPGVCGSFLLSKQSPGLYGIHTAGVNTGKGFSELLFRETFASLEAEPQFETLDLPIRSTKYMPNGPHEVVGTVPMKHSVAVSRKTRIKPSLVHGVFPTRTEPAPLTAEDPRLLEPIDPLMAGVEKRCDLMRDFDKLDLELATQDLKHMLDVNCVQVRQPELLSHLDAARGIPGIKGMERIHMTSSEGYPYVLDRPPMASDKSWLFKFNDTDVVGIDPRLVEILDHKEKLRSQGRVPKSFFAASLKDARILKEKTSMPGKTRVFEMSPVDLTIAQRSYYLDFYASYMRNNIQCEHTIGINPNSEEWSFLAHHMLQFSPHILAGDYSSYGPKMSLDVLHAAWDIKTAWMIKRLRNVDKKAVFKRMTAIKFECLHSFLLVGNYVMKALGGMHSGNCATVILNSLCNSLLVRVAYMGIMRKLCPKKASLYSFHQNVRMVSNGDDLLLAVKPEIIEWFNNVTLSEFFARYNIKYTNSKKMQDIVAWENISEVTYLKNNFVKHPFRANQWLAALDKVSIEDTPQWIWNNRNDLEATVENCEQAIRLSYGQGEEYYNMIARKLRKAVSKLGVYLVYPTWRELDIRIWDDGEILVSQYA